MTVVAGLRSVIPADAVLLPIDMQRGFDAPGRPALCSRPDGPALALLKAWRESGRIVVHVRHDSIEPGSPFAPGLPGNALCDGFLPEPGEVLVTKSVNAAFDQPGLVGATIAAAQVHAIHLATLANEFAEVASVEDIVAKLGRA